MTGAGPACSREAGRLVGVWIYSQEEPTAFAEPTEEWCCHLLVATGKAEKEQVREEGRRSIWTRGGHGLQGESGVQGGHTQKLSSTDGWEGAGEVSEGRCVHRSEKRRPGRSKVNEIRRMKKNQKKD